jgi:hypothetical protein
VNGWIGAAAVISGSELLLSAPFPRPFPTYHFRRLIIQFSLP